VNKKILQIMPETTGRVVAIYETFEPTGEDGGPEYFAQRVHGWALIEETLPSSDEVTQVVVALVIAAGGGLIFVGNSLDIQPAGCTKPEHVLFYELFECPANEDTNVADTDAVLAYWKLINNVGE
jgi:hypothetical protein